MDGELEQLFERARVVPPAPDVVRARGMARARAALATAVASERLPAPVTQVHRLRVALAASVALTLGAAGAIAAIRGWTPHHRQLPASHEELRPPPTAKLDSRGAGARARVLPDNEAGAKPRLAGRGSNDLYAAELDLLQRAQAAFVGKDVAGALVVLAEHARRFPNGRLAEEREAIRVQSLASAGRVDEARRAADAFAARFPRSVLLPRLKKSAHAGE